MKDVLDAQQTHWERVFAENSDLFGVEPSYPARKAANLFKKERKSRILELGAGQGRDAIFFAGLGLQVYVLDYSETGLREIRKKAEELGVSRNFVFVDQDVRKPLPFPDGTFDACYSHMLFCMALTTADLLSLNGEVHRVLKVGGFHVYTARNTEDPHYGKGSPRGDELFENDGFIVHFFSREKINLLSRGFDLMDLESFDEGPLPRKLFMVTLRKSDRDPSKYQIGKRRHDEGNKTF